jgi:peptidoglycan LD-endopeptidase LytH
MHARTAHFARVLLHLLTAALVVLFVGASPLSAASTSTLGTKSASKYAIAIPVLFGVTLSDITPNFGEMRGGGTRTHEGLDIMAPEGTPVVSPVRGTVQGFGTAANPGKYVYVRGSDGHTYAFMHLDEIAKLKRGQKLKVGDVLGTVGETGNAKGTVPHLHFEIRKGKPLDPYLRITKEFTLKEKITFLNAALPDLRGDDELVTRMADRYRGILVLARAEKLKLNSKFVTALSKTKSDVSLASTTVGLTVGDSGRGVVALQHALIEAYGGPAAYALAQAGSTGYFGSVTKSALIEYQRVNGLISTGVFDAQTKAHMVLLLDNG